MGKTAMDSTSNGDFLGKHIFEYFAGKSALKITNTHITETNESIGLVEPHEPALEMTIDQLCQEVNQARQNCSLEENQELKCFINELLDVREDENSEFLSTEVACELMQMSARLKSDKSETAKEIQRLKNFPGQHLDMKEIMKVQESEPMDEEVNLE